MMYLQALLICLLVPTILASCPVPECDHGCGLTLGDDGCAHCDCDVSPANSDCLNACPMDVGCIRQDNGCLKIVDGGWRGGNPPPPTPPPQSGHDHGEHDHHH